MAKRSYIMPRIDLSPDEHPTGQQIQLLRNWLIVQGHPFNVAAQIAVSGVVLSEIADKARAIFKELPKSQ